MCCTEEYTLWWVVPGTCMQHTIPVSGNLIVWYKCCHKRSKSLLEGVLRFPSSKESLCQPLLWWLEAPCCILMSLQRILICPHCPFVLECQENRFFSLLVNSTNLVSPALILHKWYHNCVYYSGWSFTCPQVVSLLSHLLISAESTFPDTVRNRSAFCTALWRCSSQLCCPLLTDPQK